MQDDAIERLTQLYTEKKTTAPTVAAAQREPGQLTVEEYAKQWRPRQRKMTDCSTGEHVDGSINAASRSHRRPAARNRVRTHRRRA
ncbi:hypothetical protein [Streptomyces sp. NPDC057748]|uniref:hypothetical protein n=1 Tax=unclassified Streptomyces TaxID=2593676 RepID=UPI0036BFC916